MKQNLLVTERSDLLPRRAETLVTDAAGLRNLENLLGDRFIAGFVLYTGQQTLPFGSKIRALPLEALWRVRP